MNKKQPGRFKAGDTVTYVICKDDTDKKYTERAYHPSEVIREKLSPDTGIFRRSLLSFNLQL